LETFLKNGAVQQLSTKQPWRALFSDEGHTISAGHLYSCLRLTRGAIPQSFRHAFF
jgi:hypothetical protein